MENINSSQKGSEIIKVLIKVGILNLMVSLAKIIVGILLNVKSILSDGIHSLGDGTINLIGIISARVSMRPPDENHPYGYEKYETIATNFIAAVLLIMSFEVLKEGIITLITKKPPKIINLHIGYLTLICTIIVNIISFLYEKNKGKKLKSEFLVADATDTQGDVLVSLGVIAGVFGISKGLYFLDGLISVGIGILILYNAFKVLKITSDILTDTAVIPPQEICKALADIPEVKFVHAIRSRGKPDAVYIDFHLGVDANSTVKEAHDEISHKVKEILSKKFPNVKYINIHIEPDTDEAKKRVRSVFKGKDKYSYDCKEIFENVRKGNKNIRD